MYSIVPINRDRFAIMLIAGFGCSLVLLFFLGFSLFSYFQVNKNIQKKENLINRYSSFIEENSQHRRLKKRMNDFQLSIKRLSNAPFYSSDVLVVLKGFGSSKAKEIAFDSVECSMSKRRCFVGFETGSAQAVADMLSAYEASGVFSSVNVSQKDILLDSGGLVKYKIEFAL